jgi:uncharacterized membrane protein YtjA (UPF0391 family)
VVRFPDQKRILVFLIVALLQELLSFFDHCAPTEKHCALLRLCLPFLNYVHCSTFLVVSLIGMTDRHHLLRSIRNRTLTLLDS